MENVKELLKNLSKEDREKLIETVMAADDVNAVIEKAKEMGLEIAEDKAQEMFDQFKKTLELSDEDLAKIAGGSGSGSGSKW